MYYKLDLTRYSPFTGHPTAACAATKTRHHTTISTSKNLMKRKINLGRAEDSLHKNTSDLVGVRVGGGPPVLEVTALFYGALARNTDGGTTVGDTI